MKKSKYVLVTILTVVMLFSSYLSLISKVYAEESNREAIEKSQAFKGLVAFPTTPFEMSPEEMLSLYAFNSTKENTSQYGFYVLRNRMDVSGKKVILMKTHLQNGFDDKWCDSKIDGNDATDILTLMQGYMNKYQAAKTTSMADANNAIINKAQDVLYSIAEDQGISIDDIELSATVIMPKIEGYTDKSESYTINLKEGFTEDAFNKVKNWAEINKRVSVGQYENITEDDVTDDELNTIYTQQQYTTIKAVTKDGAEYQMVVGTDDNFYMYQTKEAEVPEEPVPELTEPAKEFSTTLDYTSEEKGKMDGKTYLPPYYENEDKDGKKDLDATAIIKSTTKEEIVKTNGVDMREDGKPNSEGWYYPDTNDKTTIAKDYPFDTYNNPTDNGAVKETVGLTGKDGGKDSQVPDIRWTLRRIDIDKKTNDDGSITETITYNLPIDEKSIPEGWAPIKDSDGGIRKITRTFKPEDGDYDKDVTVKRNGPIDEKVTTPVKVKWEKLPKIIPQAGVFSAIAIVTIAGLGVIAFTRYRKIK